MKLFLILLSALTLQAQDISGERIRSHVKFLASDLLEGRGVGARGGDLATEYLASQLAVLGAKPAGVEGTYFQPFTMTGVTTDPATKLTATSTTGSSEFSFEKDFVGQTQTRQTAITFDSEIIFVGHGITAPEYGWDDYGTTDVKGKVVVLFTNEPPSTDPKFFGGPALTYYGRWTYKYEEATRRGAAAVLIIHTDETAGYGWEVVRNSWGKEDPQSLTGTLGMAGWLTRDAATRLLALSGRQIDELLTATNTRGFRAFPLNSKITGTLRSQFRAIPTRNVLGIIRGSDPFLSKEVVIYSAHWDHLGMEVKPSGDGIYNGATDNATGCAVLLEIATAWVQLEPKPKRSVMFLFTSAEESGLRGAEYYVAHPLVPLTDTALVLNFDSYFPIGRTSDMSLLGLERTTFQTLAQQVAARLNLTLAPESRPEQGLFFRSDHFPFAKQKVAGLSLKQGRTFLANAEARMAILTEYESKRYHQPGDEYQEDWDFSGMVDVARFGLALGQAAGSAPAKVHIE
jgi:Zn-dependent M28 family amino/carboxypeptidase